MSDRIESDPTESEPHSNFIRTIVEQDLRDGKHDGRVVTRFPPEPNGYLHIGHAKAICVDFGVAADYGGRCHLRFDDTNPEKEKTEYVEGIQRDIRWLGFDWGEHLYFASSYFERMYESAVVLIRKGKAYVDSLSAEEIREYRGTISEPGRNSPHRDRSVEENLDLFARMRAGEFVDGAHVLRAKIDMTSPHMILRDPPLYRIRHATHHRTGDAWCIYPMYDFAHCLEDAFEGVTHSFCSLEFENNRVLYDWVLEEVGTEARPRQYEFARLAVTGTLMSKRKLRQLVEEGHVAGWYDPRMPTLGGMRRRGVPPAAIRSFCEMIGVSKANSLVDAEKLDYCIRNELNHVSPRVMCVLRPLEVVLTNYAADTVEELDAPYFPDDVVRPVDAAGPTSRKVPFSRVLYIEREDFAEEPPPKWHRLSPGEEVRLRYGYVIRCTGVEKDPDSGEVVRLLCTYDPATRGGDAPGRKIKGTIHWVSAAQSVPCEARLYGPLFRVDKPGTGDLREELNPDSLEVLSTARVERSARDAEPGTGFQFTRQGYFVRDTEDTDRLVFNRTVTLRDSWAKISGPKTGARSAARASTSPVKADPPAAPVEHGPSAEREAARAADPELAERFRRYQDDLGLDEDTADTLTGDLAVARFFDAAVDAGAAPGTPGAAGASAPPPLASPSAGQVAKWVVNEVLRELKERSVAELAFDPAQLAGLVELVESGRISATAGKEVFAEMARSGASPAEVVRRLGLEQVSDAAALEATVQEVLVAHPDEAARFRDGQAQLLGFLVGQVMKASGGSANPKVVRTIFLRMQS